MIHFPFFSFFSLSHILLFSFRISRMPRKHSATTFQEDWLSDAAYSGWIKKIPHQPSKAYCSVCHTTVDIETGGKAALDSHNNGKKHGKNYEAKLKSPIAKAFRSDSSSSEGQASSSSSPASSTVSSSSSSTSCSGSDHSSKLPFDVTGEAMDAEILWCLHMVETHQSYRSCDKLPKLFSRMFKHDPVVEKYQMKKDKIRYLIQYGIFPVFKENLVTNINLSSWYSVSFDESYNNQQQKCQMDVNIRYWNVCKNIAETSYLTSRMLLRPNAENLKEELLVSIESLDKSKFLHLAMDGPTTNWSVLNLIDGCLEDGGFSNTINIGSCSLHILHGAFGTGIHITGWKIGKLMKAMFKILDESPARRDIYLREGTSEKFPQSFSETRWIEDEPVADRALQVWTSIIALVKYFEGLCKSRRPQNKSYETLVSHHTDILVPAKLHFFRFLATILQPYLVMFQTDAPMVAFMFDELSNILYSLLRLVYRKSKLDQHKKLRDIMNEDFLNLEQNQMDEMQVDIGAAARDQLQKAAVSAEKKRKFRKECKSAVITILLKLLERLPTNKLVIVGSSSLSPNNMVNIPVKAEARFKSLADALFGLKKITASVADNAKGQYDQFLRNVVKVQRKKFEDFNFRTQRLDEFLYPLIGTKNDCKDLWKICQLVFVLNHGQAYCERGFSVNKLTSDDNLSDDALIAQRLIYDTIKKLGDSSEVPISRELRRSCKTAHSRMVLDKSKKEQEKLVCEKDLKRKAKLDEINELKKRKIDVNTSISVLSKNLTSAAIASGSSGNKARENAIKAAAFAKQMQEKETLLKELDGFEKKLNEEYKVLQM